MQVERPDWYSRFCEDPAAACASRQRILEQVADSSALLIPAHFPTPTCVRIHRDPAGYRVHTDRP
jgi:glyoxylase-like metal-dependent hydrolase (beta-lactamase superfamily II)